MSFDTSKLSDKEREALAQLFKKTTREPEKPFVILWAALFPLVLFIAPFVLGVPLLSVVIFWLCVLMLLAFVA